MKSKKLESVLVKLASEDPKIRKQLVTAIKKEALGDSGRLSLGDNWNIKWENTYGGTQVTLEGWGVHSEFMAGAKKGETVDDAVLRATYEKLQEMWQELKKDFKEQEKRIKDSLKVVVRHQR